MKQLLKMFEQSRQRLSNELERFLVLLKVE